MEGLLFQNVANKKGAGSSSALLRDLIIKAKRIAERKIATVFAPDERHKEQEEIF
jgi:hypothetical protein